MTESSRRVENLALPPFPENVPSFDEYLQSVYPPPVEGDQLWSFYEQWGYEQYLIKTQKYDIEQLRILLNNEYNTLLLVAIGPTPSDIARWARENRCPLVAATEDWTGFVWRKVVRGLVGVALWHCADGDPFVVFPNLNSSPICQPYIGPVRPDQVEPIGEVYESEEQVIALSQERIDN